MCEKDKREEAPYWLDRAQNVNRIVYGLIAACVLFGLLDFMRDRHGVFGFEGWLGFYAWFGFMACVGLVLAAKLMRRLLMRGEDYYD